MRINSPRKSQKQSLFYSIMQFQEKKAAKRKFTEDEEYAANIRDERKEYKQALKKKIRLEKEQQVINYDK